MTSSYRKHDPVTGSSGQARGKTEKTSRAQSSLRSIASGHPPLGQPKQVESQTPTKRYSEKRAENEDTGSKDLQVVYAAQTIEPRRPKDLQKLGPVAPLPPSPGLRRASSAAEGTRRPYPMIGGPPVHGSQTVAVTDFRHQQELEKKIEDLQASLDHVFEQIGEKEALVRHHERTATSLRANFDAAAMQLRERNAIGVQQEQSIAQLKSYLDMAQRQFTENDAYCRSQQNLTAELQAHLDQAQQDRTVYKKDAKAYKREYESIQGQNEELRHERDDLSRTIRNMQERAFTKFDDPAWMPQSNDEIRWKLKDMQNKVKTWCKRYAIVSLRSDLDKPGEDSVEALVKGLEMLNGLQIDRLRTSIIGDKPWVVLQAWLTGLLYDRPFKNPFFCLEFRQSKLNQGDDAAAATATRSDELQRLYKELQTLDQGEACNWRAQTLRLLEPRPTSSINKAVITDANSRMEKARERFAHQCVETVFSSTENILAKDAISENAYRELMSIIIQSIQISCSLQVQKRNLKVKAKDELPIEFSYEDPLLEAHQLHNKALNDDPKALDGKPILLVAHPAVVSEGDGSGYNYSAFTVLKKAICVVDET
ncbi:MAG: hypothetical protein M1822_008372 [Bathelium mastoideum]|nr:MAG: hypothetical protein M1822_008372 [Bathelium mastoideum]